MYGKELNKIASNEKVYYEPFASKTRYQYQNKDKKQELKNAP